MIPKFKAKEEFWNTPLTTRPGKTARALMDDGLGEPSYSFEQYVSGPYGDRITEYFKTYALYDGQDMHPDVIAYWRNYGKGLHKYYHDNEDCCQRWCAYIPCSYDLPENKERKYPCIIIGQRTASMMMYEASSFIHMAAENELIILTGNDVNEDDFFENILNTALRIYPIDPSRIYLHGHSFGAVLSGRHAIKYAKRIAGVCMSGSQYYGADSRQKEIERAMKLRMPLVAVHCTKQSRNLLPYNVTPRRQMSPKNRMDATTSDFSLLTGYEELKFWRRINHCKPVGLEYMRNIQNLSADPSEQVLGIEFDRTHVEQREGVNHYFGDILDDQQTVMIRYVAVEGGPHAVPPHAGNIAWDFFKNFSRNIQTGALIRQGEAVGENDPFWTTAFPAIEYLTPREYVAGHGDGNFDFHSFMTDDLSACMKETLYTRLHFKGNETELSDYWASKGVYRNIVEAKGKHWVSYIPIAKKGAIPLVIYLGDTDDVMDAEASGIVQAAVSRGMMVAIPDEVNDDRLIVSITKYLSERGLDHDRIFFAGFGFGAQCAGRHAVRMAKNVKAVCLMGEQYYGYDNTHDEIDAAATNPLPVVMIHGTNEERGILPLYADSPIALPERRADHVTMSTFSLISSFSEHMFWRQLNNCKPVTLADMAATERSEDPCIKRIGAPVDVTYVSKDMGIKMLCGDIHDASDQMAIRYIALEGAPHYAFPAAANQACRFFAEHNNP